MKNIFINFLLNFLIIIVDYLKFCNIMGKFKSADTLPSTTANRWLPIIFVMTYINNNCILYKIMKLLLGSKTIILA